MHFSVFSLIKCDMAIAGGIFPANTPNTAGSCMSPVAFFRVMDAVARSTQTQMVRCFLIAPVLVVMKRLGLMPFADRDHIYAVIKSTAVNNDGAQKISYPGTPALKARNKSFLTALARADIAPESLSYIEAHGTGTPIGDPIEIEALTQVFRRSTEKKQFCGIGSIKSNLGHPTIAAGVAGVIKVALSLKNEKDSCYHTL